MAEMELERGCARLIHDKIHFLLLLPLENSCNRSAPTCRGFPGDLREGIAGLIFPQALELSPLSGPWRLLRRNQHAVNRAAQNLLSPGPQIRIDPQGLGHVKPSSQTPDSEARLPLDTNPRSRPQATAKQSDFRRARPKLDMRGAGGGWSPCERLRLLKLQTPRIASYPECGFAILCCRHDRSADVVAQPAPAGAGERKWNLDSLPLVSSKAFILPQENRCTFFAGEPQGESVITRQQRDRRSDQHEPQPSVSEPWHNARPHAEQSHDPHKRFLRTEERSRWAKRDSLRSVVSQKRVGAC